MKRLLNKENWAYALFWSWNVIFLAFMVLGFAPTLLPELVAAVRTSTIPVDFLIYAGILTLIPLGAVILGATVLRHEGIPPIVRDGDAPHVTPRQRRRSGTDAGGGGASVIVHAVASPGATTHCASPRAPTASRASSA